MPHPARVRGPRPPQHAPSIPHAQKKAGIAPADSRISTVKWIITVAAAAAAGLATFYIAMNGGAKSENSLPRIRSNAFGSLDEQTLQAISHLQAYPGTRPSVPCDPGQFSDREFRNRCALVNIGQFISEIYSEAGIRATLDEAKVQLVPEVHTDPTLQRDRATFIREAAAGRVALFLELTPEEARDVSSAAARGTTPQSLLFGCEDTFAKRYDLVGTGVATFQDPHSPAETRVYLARELALHINTPMVREMIEVALKVPPAGPGLTFAQEVRQFELTSPQLNERITKSVAQDADRWHLLFRDLLAGGMQMAAYRDLPFMGALNLLEGSPGAANRFLDEVTLKLRDHHAAENIYDQIQRVRQTHPDVPVVIFRGASHIAGIATRLGHRFIQQAEAV